MIREITHQQGQDIQELKEVLADTQKLNEFQQKMNLELAEQDEQMDIIQMNNSNNQQAIKHAQDEYKKAHSNVLLRRGKAITAVFTAAFWGLGGVIGGAVGAVLGTGVTKATQLGLEEKAGNSKQPEQ